MTLAYLREISRFLITAFAALYCVLSYALLINRRHSDDPLFLALQYALGLSCRVFGYLAMYAASKDLNYLFFFAFAEIILFAGYFLFRMLLPMGFAQILQDLSMLLGIGMMMLARLNMKRGVRQLFFALIAFVFALAIPWLLPRLKRLSYLPYLLGISDIFLLSAVLLKGAVVHGSKLNVSVMGFTMQPSEAAKIVFVFFLAGVYVKKPKLPEFLLIGSISALHVLILVFSRDLGGALIYFVIYVFMTALAYRRPIILLPFGFFGAAAAWTAYRLFSHVQVRVQAFLDPWSVIDHEGFQLTQSLFAICSGGLFGLGLLRGTPGDIPYVATDFIFSAIAEELGLVFSILLLMICLHVFLTALKISDQTSDPFGRLFAFGLGICYLFQVFLTVGGGIKFIPLTGVTLPLISYGGSSLITTVMLFGFLYTVSAGKAGEQAELPCRNILRGIAMGAAVLFMTLSVYTASYAYRNYQPLLSNNYNGRQRALIRQNIRGKIFSATGEVLALTVTDEEGNESREYPFGSLFSHVVGYSTRGRMGLEEQYNYYLINSDLSLSKKLALEENGEKFPADNIYTTLDPVLQEVADTAIGVYKGAAVVSDPNTGRILAMVSKPDFDPAQIPLIWDELLENPDDSRLVNRVTQGLYPPGSTFKIMTALEYIREHPDDYESYRYNCNGKYTADGYSISCYHGTSHGKVDFAESFARSCNSSFANIGFQLDRDRFGETLEELFFGRELPGVLPIKESTCNVSSATTTYDMLQTAIGQGKTQMSPMHLNLITQAIANRGAFHEPLLVTRVEAADGSLVKSFTPDKGNAIMKEEEASALGALMEEVVLSGTGKKLSGLSYTAAGKTGSAEFGATKGDSHAWFTGYAPVEDPCIAVTVIIEGAGSGSDYAVPIAKRIFDVYFEEE